MRILALTVCLILLFATVSTAKILVAFYVDIAEDVKTKSIAVMEDDGTGLQIIHTDDNRKPAAVRWSPDGKQIVFDRLTKPGNSQAVEVVLIHSDGTNERILAHGGLPHLPVLNHHPVFSPDGQSVLFSKSMQVDNALERNVCILDLASGDIKEITDFGVNFPDWSPDGKQIVYGPITTVGIGRNVNVNSTLLIMEPDGRHPRELLPPPPQGANGISRAYARWSPNGKQIVFYEFEFKYNPQLGFIPQAHRYFIYDVRTRKTEQLRIPKTYRPSGLDWMDDDKAILFSALKVELNAPVGGQVRAYALYRYEIAAKRITRLSEKSWRGLSLDWISDDVLPVSPHGKKKVMWGTVKQ